MASGRRYFSWYDNSGRTAIKQAVASRVASVPGVPSQTSSPGADATRLAAFVSSGRGGRAMSAADEGWMRRALELAERGRGAVEPNPLVGAVLVRGGQAVGEGLAPALRPGPCRSQRPDGRRRRRRGAALYVTLEPCCHHGKTPPCTDALLRAGVTRVVAAMSDPFPEVAGKGADQLRQAGVEVEFGLCEAAARRLNAPYLTLLATGQPYVHAKWAMTLDGKIATRERRLEMDQQRGVAPASPRPARPNGRGDRRHRHGPGRRSAADRAPAGTAHRRARGSGQQMSSAGRVRCWRGRRARRRR